MVRITRRAEEITQSELSLRDILKSSIRDPSSPRIFVVGPDGIYAYHGSTQSNLKFKNSHIDRNGYTNPCICLTTNIKFACGYANYADDEAIRTALVQNPDIHVEVVTGSLYTIKIRPDTRLRLRFSNMDRSSYDGEAEGGGATFTIYNIEDKLEVVREQKLRCLVETGNEEWRSLKLD